MAQTGSRIPLTARRIEKIAKNRGKPRGLVSRHLMTGGGYHLDVRIGQQCLEILGVAWRADAVALAPDEQGGLADPVQALAQTSVGNRPEILRRRRQAFGTVEHEPDVRLIVRRNRRRLA